jgi:hypothetical protein
MINVSIHPFVSVCFANCHSHFGMRYAAYVMHSKHKKTALKDLWQHQQTMGCLPPEVDHQGNIEYKVKAMGLLRQQATNYILLFSAILLSLNWWILQKYEWSI